MENKIANISIINAYAPVNEAPDNEKEEFYDNMDDLCAKIPHHDTAIIMGDFNAKINNHGKEEFIQNVDVAGKNTIHEVTTDMG
ncbi:hypothetical protein QE152_g11065 [Popillia japonica]|uniref:Craniofacial development protein 2 n=1 Tax=Popillia japonica TaxID=7064 RepID=A0AAW1LRM6_POPJA